MSQFKNQLRKVSRAGNQMHRAAADAFERLEGRTMMSAVIGGGGGIVDHFGPPAPIVTAVSTTVLGTSRNDVIDVIPGTAPGSVEVTVDGWVMLNQSWSSLGSKGLIIEGNGGNDTVNIGNGNLSSFDNTIHVQDTGGKATISVNDSTDNDSRVVTQTSSLGNDVITGIAPSTISFNESQTGSLTLKIGNGNNIAHAGAGNQTIVVGNGQNTLYGGSGNDTLTTGTGNDTVVTIGDGPAQINGGGGLNSYWIDSGSSQKIHDSLEGWEKLVGNVHTVSGYQKLVVDYVHGGTASQTPPLGPLTGSLLEPDSTITIQTSATTTNTTTYPYQNFASSPLFAPGGPTQNDIHQGAIGDCGFLAGIAAIAKNDPNWIEQSVVSLGDGTYAVQFFKTPTDPVYYRIDAELPMVGSSFIAANAGVDGCIWAPLLEKAFTFFRLDEGSYQSIQGGGCGTGLDSVGLGFTAVWGSSATNVLRTIATELSDFEIVTAGTVATPNAADYVVGSHCYTVESVQFSGGVPVSITLRNPWGYDGPNIKANPSAYGTLSAAQFYRDFDTTDVGGL